MSLNEHSGTQPASCDDDTIHTLLETVVRLLPADPAQALLKAREAYDLAREPYDRARDTGDPADIAAALQPFIMSLLMLGLVYHNDGDAASAQAAFDRADKLCRTLQSHNAVADILIQFPRNCSIAGKHDIALDYFDRALDYCRRHGLRKRQADCLNQIGIAYARVRSMDLAIRNFQQALAIAEEIDHNVMRVNIWANIGNVYRMISEFPRALEYYSRSLVVASQLGDVELMLLCLNNVGIIYASLGEYADALEYFLRCEGYLEAEFSETERYRYTNTLNNIGNLYEKIGNFDKALEYHRKALAIRRETNDRKGEADSLHNLGIAYQAIGEYERAYKYAGESLAIRETLGDPGDLSLSYNGIGNIQECLGDYDDAIANHLRSIALADATGDRLHKAHFLLNLGSSYHKKGATEQAMDSVYQALALAEEMVAKSVLREAHETLAQIFRTNGDFEQALHHYELYHRTDKEIFNDINAQKIRNLQTLHQVEQTKQEMEIYRLKNVELATALTELEATNTRLREVNNEKNELMNIVAHDLKNPLSSIMMLADILRNDETLTRDEVMDFSGDILHSSERMFNLITNLLDINAVENRGSMLTVFPFDVVPVVQHAVQHFQPRAAQKSITLHQQFDREQMLVEAEREALGQILDNLISNALKFSPADTNVRVTVRDHIVADAAPTVRIEVRDEGPGISADDMARLFTKFTRLSARPTAGEHSTGLGLSIVHKLVEAMQGRVWCESEEGRGATFIVELPVPAFGAEAPE